MAKTDFTYVPPPNQNNSTTVTDLWLDSVYGQGAGGGHKHDGLDADGSAAKLDIDHVNNLDSEHNADGTHKTVTVEKAAASNDALTTAVAGDTAPRMALGAGGNILLGDGTVGGLDVLYGRTGLKALEISDDVGGDLNTISLKALAVALSAALTFNDVKLVRDAMESLVISDTSDSDLSGGVLVKGKVAVEKPVAGNDAFTAAVTGDTGVRMAMNAGGSILLGDGTVGGLDVLYGRTGLKALEISDDVGGDLNTFSVKSANSDFSGHVSVLNNSKLIGQPVAFYAHISGNQNIPTGTFVRVQFATKKYDTFSAFDSTTNYRFTPGTLGKYALTVQVAIASPTNDTVLMVQLRKNGTIVLSHVVPMFAGVGSSVHVNFSGNYDVALGTDYFDVYVRQDSGGTIPITGASGIDTFFTGYLIALSSP